MGSPEGFQFLPGDDAHEGGITVAPDRVPILGTKSSIFSEKEASIRNHDQPTRADSMNATTSASSNGTTRALILWRTIIP
jgi:hypothetical protein